MAGEEREWSSLPGGGIERKDSPDRRKQEIFSFCLPCFQQEDADAPRPVDCSPLPLPPPAPFLGEESPLGHRAVHGEMDSKEGCICIYLLVCIIVLVAVLFAFGIIYMDYHLKKVEQQNHSCVCPPVLSGPACPDGWVGYRGKCYNVPDVKKDWPSSQKACSSENASLLTFSHDKEKEFVMRYLYNGTTWLGLSKDPDQLWGWTNGEKSIETRLLMVKDNPSLNMFACRDHSGLI